MNLEDLIQHWGYLAVLVGTFLEGETILVLAGVAAQQDQLQLPYVMLCAFCGSLISDQLAFFIGRHWGMKWLTRKPGRAERYERARAMIDRHQTLITLLFRFLYGLRNVIPFALGMSRMKTSRYIVLNVIGAAVWAAGLALLGWGFGKAAELFLGRVKTSQKWFLLGLAILAGGFFLYYKWRERKKQRARLAEQKQRDATTNAQIVYVALLNEGEDAWRPVQAQHLGADKYRLQGPAPETEEWAYKPGDVVCCREQQLNGQLELVAFARSTE